MRTSSFALSCAATLCCFLPMVGCKSSPSPQPVSTVPAAGQSAPAAVPSTAANPATTAGPAPVTAPSAAAPVAPATVASAPAPAPALVVPSGTRATIRLDQTLSAQRNDVGQSFTGVLEYPITVHGVTAFRKGDHVAGEVVAAKGKGRFKGSGMLGIELRQIGGVPVQTSEYEAVAKGRGKRTAGFIGGGGGLGAIIGGIAGGGKGALIGGLAGAGAGTAGAAYTGNRDVVISSESRITFRLTSSVAVR
jgi:hypothetical protein